MKTGKVSGVEEDNDDFTYYFNTKNGRNGEGVTGVKDNYLYFNGKRLEADDDYRLWFVNGKIYLVNNKGKIQKSKTKSYDIEGMGDELKVEFNGESVSKIVGKDTMFVTVPEICLYDHVYSYGFGVEDGENVYWEDWDPTGSFADWNLTADNN